MYSTCLFCHGALGRNEVVEHFSVGTRLAFDADRGRLWVVCRRCAQWNLTPLEERWEAVEECERLFRDTRLRVSTDEIGLARVASGLELVRIGRPQRPEFAAWRYGDQFGRRRRVAFLKVGLGLGALGAIVAGGFAVGIGIGGAYWGVQQVATTIVKGSPRKVMARLPNGDGDLVIVRRKHLRHLQLFAANGQGTWSLGVPHRKTVVRYEGEAGLRAMGQLLPQLNRFGGSETVVREAVGVIEREIDPARFVAATARTLTASRALKIADLPEANRLALEMASHEESERRALEGELAALSEAWREAEEVAGIADNMFLPASVDDFLRRHRRT